MKIHLVTFLTLSGSSVIALACFATPQEQVVPAEDLVKRTARIALAKVVEARLDPDSGQVVYSFTTEQAIKGAPDKSFSITGYPLEAEVDLLTFDHHRSEEFWEGGRGRCYHDTDCQIHPAFAVGSTYLIFLDKPYHQKSFEWIQMFGTEPEKRDKWLSWVEKTVKADQ